MDGFTVKTTFVKDDDFDCIDYDDKDFELFIPERQLKEGVTFETEIDELEISLDIKVAKRYLS